MGHRTEGLRRVQGNGFGSADANPLVNKLGRFASFDDADEQAIRHLTRRYRSFAAHETIVFQDSQQQAVHVILSGVAYRCRHLTNGRRQIFGYLLAGDFCDAHFVIADECDYSLCVLTDAVVAQIPVGELISVMVSRPRIERSMLMSSLVDSHIVREWLVNVGQRDGLPRLAHFFCEMAARLEFLGASNADGSIAIPVTQLELADTLGMTTVHINRILQRLRNDGLIVWKCRRLTILNPMLLEQVAGFDRRYLALATRPACPQTLAYGMVPAEIF